MSDPDCIFCKIVAGEIPAEKVYEDAAAVAFLDIGPLAEGHVLLIPKQHWATLDQMPASAASAVLGALPGLARAVQAATGCEGLNVLQNNGQVAGQLVPHVHFHLIPRNPDDPFQFNWPTGSYAQGRMSALARSIREHLA